MCDLALTCVMSRILDFPKTIWKERYLSVGNTVGKKKKGIKIMVSILSPNAPWLFIVNSFPSHYFPFFEKKKSLIYFSICHKMFSTFQVCHMVPNKGEQYSKTYHRMHLVFILSLPIG